MYLMLDFMFNIQFLVSKLVTVNILFFVCVHVLVCYIFVMPIWYRLGKLVRIYGDQKEQITKQIWMNTQLFLKAFGFVFLSALDHNRSVFKPKWGEQFNHFQFARIKITPGVARFKVKLVCTTAWKKMAYHDTLAEAEKRRNAAVMRFRRDLEGLTSTNMRRFHFETSPSIHHYNTKLDTAAQSQAPFMTDSRHERSTRSITSAQKSMECNQGIYYRGGNNEAGVSDWNCLLSCSHSKMKGYKWKLDEQMGHLQTMYNLLSERCSLNDRLGLFITFLSLNVSCVWVGGRSYS